MPGGQHDSSKTRVAPMGVTRSGSIWMLRGRYEGAARCSACFSWRAMPPLPANCPRFGRGAVSRTLARSSRTLYCVAAPHVVRHLDRHLRAFFHISLHERVSGAA
jgi:hypothetical protein